MSEMDIDKAYNLVWALRVALAAIDEEQKAKNEYHGYDWGYHGHNYKNDVDDGIARVAKALAALQTQDQSDKGGLR